jgi:hypothetical protein
MGFLDSLQKQKGTAMSPVYVFATPIIALLLDVMLKLSIGNKVNSYPPFSFFKGKTFSMLGLIAVVTLFSIDDVGTSIGLQGEDKPIAMIEGNPHMVYIWDWLIRKGWAKTETAAHRIILLILIGEILLIHYFGYATPIVKSYLFLIGGVKTYAGYAWWTNKPNNFSISDFLSFKPGRPTPERRSAAARDAYNKQFAAKRKLLEQSPATNGTEWLVKYLPVFFGPV